MMRVFLPPVAIGMAVALAGCNETAGGAVAGPVLSTPVAPSALRLPSGTTCSWEIGQYQSIVQADLETGNVEQKVYDQIQSELTRAAAACTAGKSDEAHAIVARSKAAHGYRA